jgi:predicted metallo-beta-lactamase superfamily hydrolase
MRTVPLAFESLGTRGMSTWVETQDSNILIDPGVNLAPERFGLPPHPIELRRKEEHWKKIERFASRSDVLIVTHYHFDHINPEGLYVFEGKVALVKHPSNNINYNQEQRAKEILPTLKSIAADLLFADGREFDFGRTHVSFSRAVHHGTHPRVFTIQVSITDGVSTLVHTSDVMGAELDQHIDFALCHNPDLLIIDGPSFSLRKPTTEGIIRIMTHTDVRTVIVEHHLLRDERWKDQIVDVYDTAKLRNVKVVSAAEFLGKRNDLLEARRQKLYTDHPVERGEETRGCQ